MSFGRAAAPLLLFFLLAAQACADGDQAETAASSAAGAAGTGGTNANAGAGGGASAGSGGSGGSGSWASYCAMTASCGKTQHCPTEACVASVWVQALIPSVAECLLAQGCSGGDDACIDKVSFPNGIGAEDMAALTSCTAKLDGCKKMGAKTPTDGCSAVAGVLIRPELRAAAKACLEKPCADVAACYDTALAPFGCFDN